MQPGKAAQDSPVCGDLRMVGRSDKSRASRSTWSQRALVAQARPTVRSPRGCPSNALRGGSGRWLLPPWSLTAFWGIQRIPQSLWDDEDSSLHRAVLGQYRRDKSGELKLKETTWEIALWNYWKPANHQLQTVLSKACLQAWRDNHATCRTPIQRAGGPLSMPCRRSLVRRFPRAATQATGLRKSGRDRGLPAFDTPLARSLCH